MKKRLPDYLKIKLTTDDTYHDVALLLRQKGLHTVCEEALCPNRYECFSNKTATFMILGDNCTRNCSFCNVSKESPRPVDPLEPEHIAEAITSLKLEYAVITSVTRDDLSDGGASHFAAVIESVQKKNPGTEIEVLIPDFQGDLPSLEKVIQARPEVINHNIETVPRLYNVVRPQADYKRSLDLLTQVKKHSDTIYTKSGIMLGFGEQKDEVLSTLRELREVDCDIVTIGQYLRPSRNHYPVIEYIEPNMFDYYKKAAYEMGFRFVASAPLVRSSYKAKEGLTGIK